MQHNSYNSILLPITNVLFNVPTFQELKKFRYNIIEVTTIQSL